MQCSGWCRWGGNSNFREQARIFSKTITVKILVFVDQKVYPYWKTALDWPVCLRSASVPNSQRCLYNWFGANLPNEYALCTVRGLHWQTDLYWFPWRNNMWTWLEYICRLCLWCQFLLRWKWLVRTWVGLSASRSKTNRVVKFRTMYSYLWWWQVCSHPILRWWRRLYG